MLSPLRNRFGFPGVISVVALVFAMFGGAYAASNNGGGKATASAKAKRGPRGPKGATGPVGPAGSIGPAGPKGDAGAAGANGTIGAPGTAGANGNTVLSGTGAPANGTGVNGDFYIDKVAIKIYGPKTAGAWPVGVDLKGANGTNGSNGTNGTNGSPWVVGTAPSGATLKGTWSVQGSTASAADEKIPVSISTTVPISSGSITAGQFLLTPDPNNLFGCTGTAAAPTTEFAGILCVYVSSGTNIKDADPGFAGPNFELASSGGGAVMNVRSEGAGLVKGYGSWVLTLP